MRQELFELSRTLQSRRDTSKASDDHLVSAMLHLITVIDSQDLELISLRRRLNRVETSTGDNL